jgi:N-acyl-D-aspartate/D-glutamate deacylase
VNDLPAGGTRLAQDADGIHATIVNGEILLRDGTFTEARPGQLVRGPLAAIASR